MCDQQTTVAQVPNAEEERIERLRQLQARRSNITNMFGIYGGGTALLLAQLLINRETESLIGRGDEVDV